MIDVSTLSEASKEGTEKLHPKEMANSSGVYNLTH